MVNAQFVLLTLPKVNEHVNDISMLDLNILNRAKKRGANVTSVQ
jgi:hypothetical protein